MFLDNLSDLLIFLSSLTDKAIPLLDNSFARNEFCKDVKFLDWLHEVKTLIICGDSAVTPNVEFYHDSPFMTEVLANEKVTKGNPGTDAGSGRKTKQA